MARRFCLVVLFISSKYFLKEQGEDEGGGGEDKEANTEMILSEGMIGDEYPEYELQTNYSCDTTSRSEHPVLPAILVVRLLRGSVIAFSDVRI